MSRHQFVDSLRFRFITSFFWALLPILILTGVGVELLLVPAFERQAKQELTNATRVLTNSIRAGASVAIRNHLKGIAEKNLDIASHYLALAEQGLVSRAEAVTRLRTILLSQQIGSSGYIYCLNSSGILDVHPKEGLEGSDISRHPFVREQLRLKEGYLEYDWKNPGESSSRQKALYMVYFQPLDWIISVSSYRAEFNELLSVEDFRGAVSALRFGESGYAYVMDRSGDLLIHPQLDNYNILLQRDLPSGFASTMLSTGAGSIEYEWRNPADKETRKKIAAYESIPDYGWLVVSSAYLQEILNPVKAVRIIAYLAALLMFISAAAASYYLSGRLSNPIDAMMEQLDQNARLGTHDPLPIYAQDELGRLAGEFNSFLLLIERQNRELKKERQRYLNLFETSPDAIFFLKGETIIDCNPSTLVLFGGDREHIVGKTIAALSPPAQADGTDSGQLAEVRIRKAAEISLQTFEWIHQTLDGRTFDAEVRLKYFGEGDERREVVAFVRDMSRQKRVLEELQKSECQYRQLIENAHDAIFIVQGERIIFANQQTEELTGFTCEELGTFSYQNIIHPDDRSMVARRYLKRVKGDQDIPPTYTFRICNKDNSERTVQLSAVVIEWQGEPASLSFVRDITEQKKLEAALVQAQKMDAIATLAGGIAHDFNNLLVGIQGRISMMSARLDATHRNQEHFKAIEEYIRSATDLTSQMLGITRGGKYDPKPVDLRELVAQTASMFGRTKKEIRIVSTANPTPVVVDGDKRQIEQVLLNIYVNAWQAMPGGGELHLQTSAAELSRELCSLHGIEAGTYAHISIRDTGMGMDEATCQRIFDPFFTTKEMGRGTGLGLASAFGIVKNHGGMIRVKSQPGQGTTFSVYLPISGREAATESFQEAEPVQGKETVLLVDDEAVIIEVGREMLKTLGYRVLVAESGRAALAAIAESGSNIDLVILDMIMPEMNGETLFYRIRDIFPQMPIIVSSGYALSEQAVGLMKQGCNGFMQKPYNLSTLSQNVRSVLDAVRAE
ncbi:cache domain-containing protein [Desulfogranum mediterraneum]|uniref:cache domain-containing protein n=1 Tax=Desulfogranum mediterraneum TaxID=160661 RepID=UPI000416CD81|nr:cache domain-containing protein [Desulfogranum mediterraneum]